MKKKKKKKNAYKTQCLILSISKKRLPLIKCFNTHVLLHALSNLIYNNFHYTHKTKELLKKSNIRGFST